MIPPVENALHLLLRKRVAAPPLQSLDAASQVEKFPVRSVNVRGRAKFDDFLLAKKCYRVDRDARVNRVDRATERQKWFLCCAFFLRLWSQHARRPDDFLESNFDRPRFIQHPVRLAGIRMQTGDDALVAVRAPFAQILAIAFQLRAWRQLADNSQPKRRTATPARAERVGKRWIEREEFFILAVRVEFTTQRPPLRSPSRTPIFGASSSLARWSALSMISAVSFCQPATSGRFPAHGRSTTSSPSSSRSRAFEVEVVRSSAYDVLTFVFAVARDLFRQSGGIFVSWFKWVFQWRTICVQKSRGRVRRATPAPPGRKEGANSIAPQRPAEKCWLPLMPRDVERGSCHSTIASPRPNQSGFGALLTSGAASRARCSSQQS